MCRFSIPRVDNVEIYFGSLNIGIVNCGTEVEDFKGHYLPCVSMSYFRQNNFLTHFTLWGKKSWKTVLIKGANGHMETHFNAPASVTLVPIMNADGKICQSIDPSRHYHRGPVTGFCNKVILNLQGGAIVTVSTPYPSPEIAAFSLPAIHSLINRRNSSRCFYCWKYCNGNCPSFRIVKQFYSGLYRHGGIEPGIFLKMGDESQFLGCGDDYVLRLDNDQSSLGSLVRAMGVAVVDDNQIQIHVREDASDDDADEEQYVRNLYADGEITREEYYEMMPDRGQDFSDDDD